MACMARQSDNQERRPRCIMPQSASNGPGRVNGMCSYLSWRGQPGATEAAGQTGFPVTMAIARPALRYRGLSLDPMPISAGRPSTRSARASPARRLIVTKRPVHHPVTQGLRCGHQKIQGFRLQPVHIFWERKYADKADINAAIPVGSERGKRDYAVLRQTESTSCHRPQRRKPLHFPD